jgi:DNA-binding SARP family transcriptional activator/TolB-like protein
VNALSLLGPVDLTGSDGQPVRSVLNQPKRIAFLAFLATAPSGTRTREEVLGRLWPNADREKARHALSQTLYFIRRSLGKDVIRNGGEVLALNPDVIVTDVSAFLRALDDERPAEALELYRGELLQGFVFDVDPEIDRWLDGARERLHQKALEATGLLSRQAEANGDTRSAIEWAERGITLSPLHEAPLRRFLALLMHASEPVRAREALERFSERLREELDMEPSAETVSIVEAPRSSPTDAGAPPPPSIPPAGGAVAEAPRTAPLRSPDRPNRDLPRLPSRPWWRSWRAAAAAVALILTPSLVVWASRATRSLPAAVATESGQKVAVFPFAYRGRPDLAYLADGLPELLSISVSGLSGVSVVDPRALSRTGPAEATLAGGEGARRIAREYGADHFLVGSVIEAGGQIQVTAEFHDTEGERVVTVSERAESEAQLFSLLDDLVRRLVAAEAFPNASQLERAAALTTSSLPALRHFLEGERVFRAGLFLDATHAFDAATHDDSTFALAFYRGAVASLWSEHADFDAARQKLARARQFRSQVSELDGLLLDALDEFLQGHLFRAEVLYESVLTRQPENLEAWFQLGETRFHYGGIRGREATESEEAWRRILAIAPNDRAALIHLSAIAARKGHPVLDTLEARLTTLGGDSVMVPQIRALRVFSSGSPEEQEAFVREMGLQPRETVRSTASYVARFLRDIEAADQIAEVLTTDSRPVADRLEGHLLRAYLELAQGRVHAADASLSAAARLDSAAAGFHRLILASVPTVALERRSGGERLELALRVPESSPGPMPSHFDGSAGSGLLLYGRALAYARAGGEDGALLSTARALIENANPHAKPFVQALAHALTAQRRLDRNEDAAAGEELAVGLAGVERWYENLRESWVRALVRERFLLAELELRQGNPDRAEDFLRSLADNSVAEMPYLGPSLVRIAEIRERAGDVTGAIDAYGTVLALWKDADASLDPVIAELEERVDALGGVRGAR